MNAAIDGNLFEMRSLLQKGASAKSHGFSKHSSDAFSTIICAAWDKQTAAIKLLLDNGSGVTSVYSCCMDSKSLLMMAVSMNDVPTIKLLLARNGDLSFKDHFEGWDVFDEAKTTDNPTILAILYNYCESSVSARIKCRVRRLSHLFGIMAAEAEA